MSWNWEEMTTPEFARAVEQVNGVCVLPMGVYEKHGDHLPIGTDVIAVREFARRAADIEPAIIFPPYYFGQIYEGKPFPGTVAIRHELLVELLLNTCDEIARNGMRKIILLNGHGGNEPFLSYFLRVMQDQPRGYTVYFSSLAGYYNEVVNDPAWKEQMVSDFDGHGGETETSYLLAIRPELVKMSAISPGTTPLLRLDHLPHARTGVDWYASFPDHYAGDATEATVEKGEFLLANFAEKVAAIIRSVKNDTVAEQLNAEFFARSQH